MPLDANVAGSWIFPKLAQERSYQFCIARNALFHNTLVCLPTGLGKTLIAAVVMFNLYRWFPAGKIVFLAPTRPLVEQQAKACYKQVCTYVLDGGCVRVGCLGRSIKRTHTHTHTTLTHAHTHLASPRP